MEDEGSPNKKSQTSLTAEESSRDIINDVSENIGVKKAPSSEDESPSNVIKDESGNGGEQPSEMNLLNVEPSNKVKCSGNVLDNLNTGDDKATGEMKSLTIVEENANPHNENTEMMSSSNILDDQKMDKGEASSEVKSLNVVEENPNHHNEKGKVNSSGSGNVLDDQTMQEDEATSEVKSLNNVGENHDNRKGQVKSSGNMLDDQTIHEDKATREMKSLNIVEENPNHYHEKGEAASTSLELGTANKETGSQAEKNHTTDEFHGDKKDVEPVFDGTEIPGLETAGTSSNRSLDVEPGVQGSAWPEKAMAIRDFVREKGVTAVSSVFRRLSGKGDEDRQTLANEHYIADNPSTGVKEEVDNSPGSKAKEVSQQTGERSMWNPLNFIRHVDMQNNSEQEVGFSTEDSVEVPRMKGRVTLYTRLGCQNSREIRKYLHQKRLQYIEINIDIYPSRKSELEKIAGSSAVPRVFFNDLLIGGLNELKAMDEHGGLDQKINDLSNTEPSPEAPLPPLSGEDDESGTGTLDELAITVRKMRESVTVKDRFYKMRRFTNCFLGSEAVDFFSEDQYLERDEAVEFGRKLANKCFFKHVLEENVFEDGNELYRFLDHDPFVMSQCFNFSRGIIEVKPKPIVEISSRLRFLMFAMFEAYVSEDGRRVDYQTIRSSEEFARYNRIIEELQRVDFQDVSREEKLAFFVNLHNMMVIHAILTWGCPAGALDRRRLLGDFKYVIGGCTYSLSAIQNGILRANQRPPYNITKPFGARDTRLKVALLQHEPLIHFALVSGNRSGPALRCYSPGDIDKELAAAAHDFLVNGGLIVDAEAKLASASKILKWYSADFGKNEAEVMKHVASYLEPAQSRELLDLLSSGQMKVRYQPYDWSLNC